MITKSGAYVFGRLVSKPEVVTFTGSNRLVKFTVADNQRYTNSTTGQQVEEVSYIDCECGIPAVVDRVGAMNKGEIIMAAGRLKQHRWTKAGSEEKRQKLVIKADFVSDARGSSVTRVEGEEGRNFEAEYGADSVGEELPEAQEVVAGVEEEIPF